MLILAVALCLASGYLVTAAAWPGRGASLSDWLMKLSLSVGFGLGIFSAVFFLARLLDSNHIVAVDACLLVLLLIFYFLRRTRSASVNPLVPEYRDFDAPRWLLSGLIGEFVVAVLVSLWSTVLRVIAHPHGDGWDAFAIWNLHARFLFLGGVHWRDGFSALVPWSHPDYPLLLPAATAHFWSYLGHDAPAVPATIGVVFTFSTLALLVSSLAQLRGRVPAMLAGLALSSTPFFIEQGISQYADVPLSFFILASIVLLHFGHHLRPGPRYGPMVLAGLAAGFAAWTKNEGLLFLSAVVIAQVWAFTFRPVRDPSRDHSSQSRRSLIPFALGAVPILVEIMWFKHSIAPSGDVFSSPDTMIHKILTPARYWAIVQWYAKEFLRFGNWWIVPGTVALLAFFLLIDRKENRNRDPLLRVSAVALGLTLAGYFAIYLITPRDIYWHLRFSLNRLFLQLWPTSIFLFFLFVGHHPESQIEPIPPKIT